MVDHRSCLGPAETHPTMPLIFGMQLFWTNIYDSTALYLDFSKTLLQDFFVFTSFK